MDLFAGALTGVTMVALAFAIVWKTDNVGLGVAAGAVVFSIGLINFLSGIASA